MRPRPTKPTFMMLSRECSHELPAHPLNLTADIVDNVARLQMVWKHIPGVGLDFKLARQRSRLVKFQCFLERKTRGTEWAEIVEKDRHVKMSAPFAWARVLISKL